MRKLSLFLLALILVLLYWQEGIFWSSGLVVPTYWKAKTQNYNIVKDIGYEVRVAPGQDEGDATALIQEGMQYYDDMAAYFDCTLPQPLFIFMDSDTLNDYVGDYNLSSAGAYQSGVILLGLPDNGGLSRTLVHELGHHYVHALARGNYPAWYSEGVAQLMELMFKKSVWFDGNNFNDYYKYSISDLSGEFYNLPDQVAAYRLSLELVMAIEAIGGGQANIEILRDLGQGKTFSQAIIANTGMDLQTLYNNLGQNKRSGGIE